MDDAERLELYGKLHRLFVKEPPADFLWSTDQYWGVAKRIDGVETSPFGLFHFLSGPLAWCPAVPVRIPA
jgi:ABC-type transport system substrate-binding protein